MGGWAHFLLSQSLGLSEMSGGLRTKGMGGENFLNYSSITSQS